MSASIRHAVAEEIRPSGFLDYRLYLDALYAALKRRHDSYSYQAFAADLGFGPTTVMHQVIRGRRPLTLKAAEKVVKALALKGLERQFLLSLVEYNNSRSSPRREVLFEKMIALKSEILPEEFDRDCLEYFSEWYHPVIRELVGTSSFRDDPEWIAQIIVPRLRPEQARSSLALLERLGLIARGESGRYEQTQRRISTGHRVRGMALVRYHQRMIEHGREALTRVPGNLRDISAMTVSLDAAAIQRLKDMIHAFQIQLLDEAERSAGPHIYQVNIQFFPFTSGDKREEP